MQYALRALLLIIAAAVAAVEDAYDGLCEKMIEQYQLAAKSHNAGDLEGEKLATEAGLAAYRSAIALDPTGPQAHLHQGTFLQNSHRFDEAVEIWQTVRPLVANIASRPPGGSGTWKAFIDGRETVARIGRAAVARDKSYKEGQGNIEEALVHAHELVGIAPRAPHFSFEAGTIAWVGARTAEKAFEASRLLAQAQENAAHAAAAFIRRDRSQRAGDPSGPAACPSAGRLITVSEMSALAASASAASGSSEEAGGVLASGEGWDAALGGLKLRVARSGSLGADDAPADAAHHPPFVATIEGRASLHGAEGVVTAVRERAGADGSCPLLVFGGASWPFQALHQALWLSQETWRADGAVRLFERVPAQSPPPTRHPSFDHTEALIARR